MRIAAVLTLLILALCAANAGSTAASASLAKLPVQTSAIPGG